MAAQNTIPCGRHGKRFFQLHVRLSQEERALVRERARQIEQLYPEVADGVTVRICEAEAIRAALRLWLRTDVTDAKGRVILKGIG